MLWGGGCSKRRSVKHWREDLHGRGEHGGMETRAETYACRSAVAWVVLDEANEGDERGEKETSKPGPANKRQK